MHRNKDIENQVEQALRSLDGLTTAHASPHLYTQIKGRLAEERSTWSQLAVFLSKPIVAIGLVLLVIALNVITITSSPSKTEENADLLVSLAQDYSFQPSNILENGYNQP